MTTPAKIRLMLHRTGLSQTDAADYLVSPRTGRSVEARQVRRWMSGDQDMPAEHWQQLVDLCERQDREADEAIAQIEQLARESGRLPDVIAIRLAQTQDDADRLGWPCPTAHLAVVRRVVERAPAGVIVKPVHPGEDEAADLAAARRTAH